MRKIPNKIRVEISNDPFYKTCCISGDTHDIQWHHNLIYAGKQVNEKFCILPLEKKIHADICKYKEKCDWIMVNRATENQLKKYSKVVNYILLKEKLNNVYGLYKESR